jgi:hypothetical protein
LLFGEIMKPTRKLLTVLWMTAIGLAVGHFGCGGHGLRNGVDGGGAEAAATGGAPSTGGTLAAGGSGMGGSAGMGGTSTTAPVSTGGSAGAGGSGGSVNVHECPMAYPSGLVKVCFMCDPLPAGSTEGCGLPTRCGDKDTSSPTRYPVGCEIVFPWQNTTYYPDELEAAVCYVGADGIPYWACLL